LDSTGLQSLWNFEERNMADTSNTSNPGAAVEFARKSPKIKHDWYQTDSHVIITILAKNMKQDGVKVEFGEESVSFFRMKG
jgi:suppressor of G2 allele of SKP1